jgi:hypothetical protein
LGILRKNAAFFSEYLKVGILKEINAKHGKRIILKTKIFFKKIKKNAFTRSKKEKILGGGQCCLVKDFVAFAARR